jgi:peptidoglycan/xylan/chitin deacetylase (PgdA/CDA1 family)
LTFDDGPGIHTATALDQLAARGILGAFFVVGSRVKEYPEMLKRIFEQGHQIGIHSYSHRAFTSLTTEEIVSELEYTIQAVEQITGARPIYVRPPFGDHGSFYLK